MKQNSFFTRVQILAIATKALTAVRGYEKAGGMCWRYQRQVLSEAGLPDSMIPPLGSDAKQAAQWYRTNHPELCHSNGSVPGDVVFWEVGHGPHGHVAMRLKENKYGENSTYHAPAGQEDGRGTRHVGQMDKPSLIVRFWRE